MCKQNYVNIILEHLGQWHSSSWNKYLPCSTLLACTVQEKHLAKTSQQWPLSKREINKHLDSRWLWGDPTDKLSLLAVAGVQRKQIQMEKDRHRHHTSNYQAHKPQQSAITSCSCVYWSSKGFRAWLLLSKQWLASSLCSCLCYGPVPGRVDWKYQLMFHMRSWMNMSIPIATHFRRLESC